MKRKLFTFTALFIASVTTLQVQAQDPAPPVAGTTFETEVTYVLYNVGNFDFFGASNDYGSRASLVGSTRQQIKFTEAGDGKYRIQTVSGVTPGGFIKGSPSALYVDGNSSNAVNWIITEEETGVYTIRYDDVATLYLAPVSPGASLLECHATLDHHAKWKFIPATGTDFDLLKSKILLYEALLLAPFSGERTASLAVYTNNESGIQDYLDAVSVLYSPDLQGNYSSQIINPAIGNNNATLSPNGWTCERQNTTGNNSTKSTGNTYFEVYTNTTDGVTFDYYQVLTGLPNGRYLVKARTFTQDTNGNTVLYGNENMTPMTTGVDGTNFTAENATTSVNTLVTDGTLRLGIKTAGALSSAGKWHGADDFELYYSGAVKESVVKTALKALINKAEALETNKIHTTILGNLTHVVNEAKSLLASEASDPELEDAGTLLETVIEEAKISIREYDEISASVEQTETLYSRNYPGIIHLRSSVDAVKVTLNQQDFEKETALAVLSAATRTYIVSQPASFDQPADFTEIIVNPDFNTNATGWTGAEQGSPGSGVYEFYQKVFDMHQTFTYMPAGYYQVKLQGFARPSGNDGGTAFEAGAEEIHVKLYLKAGETEVTRKLQSLYTEKCDAPDAEQGYAHKMWNARDLFDEGKYHHTLGINTTGNATLTVGIKYDVPSYVAGSWTVFDNFRLLYFGTGGKVTNEKGMVIVQGTTDLSEVQSELADETITSIDLSDAVLSGGSALHPENPQAIVYGLPDGISLTNGINAKAAGSVRLDENFAFRAPTGFSAEEITYTRNAFSGNVNHTVLGGWQTLCLPFDVDMEHITCSDGGGNLIPVRNFTNETSNLRPFWLYLANGNGFEPATEILAHVPYLILIPNDPAEYTAYYNISGHITFKGIFIKPTALKSENTGGYYLTGNFAPVNSAMVYGLDAAGTEFIPNTTVKAFSAYADQLVASDAKTLPIFGGTTGLPGVTATGHRKDLFLYASGNGTVTILSPQNCRVSVYTLDGKLFGTYKLTEGSNTLALPSGREGNKYIINGNVVIVY